MKISNVFGGLVVAAGLAFSVSGASAAPLNLLDTLKADAAAANGIETVQYGPCVWGRYRGWHRKGPYGTWRSCVPGREWRAVGRCWIGPGGVRYCRYYGR